MTGKRLLSNKILGGILVSLACAVCLTFSAASAQPPAEPPPDPAQASEPELPPDPLHRRTPEGFVFGLVQALAEEDYARAARYLDLRDVPRSRRQAQGAVLARQLQMVLDLSGQLQTPRQLSSDPAGALDDELAPELERFATVRTEAEQVDLFLERRELPDQGPIWLVSSETVAEIPDLAASAEVGLINRWLPASINDRARLLGAPASHWITLLILAVLAYLVAWLLVGILACLVRRLWRLDARDPALDRFVARSAAPVRLFVAIWIWSVIAFAIGASIVARQYLGVVAEVLAWLAVVWFALRLLDALGERVMQRLADRGQVSASSAARFIRRSAKAALIALGLVAILDSAGVDVTAGLAALGIGGLALALGAQKTVENFVGSLTLIADRPMRVGDYCRIGETTGTVEDIGMRSTRIRTLGRTRVTIPNGELAALQIENYAYRDRFPFNPKLALRYETSSDQVRMLLESLRRLMTSHPKVDTDSMWVHFTGFGESALNLEIFAYLNTGSYSDFLDIQEDLSLRIMDCVAASGTDFALPSRTLYFPRGCSLPKA